MEIEIILKHEENAKIEATQEKEFEWNKLSNRYNI